MSILWKIWLTIFFVFVSCAFLELTDNDVIDAITSFVAAIFGAFTLFCVIRLVWIS